MKIPDNQNVIIFFRKYGLIVLIAIGLIVIVRVSLIKAFTRIALVRDTECVISEDSKTMMYEGEFYKVKTINLYKSLGKIRIELEKVK